MVGVGFTGPGVKESLFSCVCVCVCLLKVSRSQGHYKVLKLSLTLMPDGGRCLNFFVLHKAQEGTAAE